MVAKPNKGGAFAGALKHSNKLEPPSAGSVAAPAQPEKTGRTKKVNIRAVASHARVSVGTVSKVLNGQGNVEKSLREKVLASAQELGYVLPRNRPVSPESSSRPAEPPRCFDLTPLYGLRQKITRLAYCCRPDISPLIEAAYNPYFSTILKGIEVECHDHNLQLVYRMVNDDDADLEYGCRLIKESEADALLLINYTDAQLVEGLLKTGLPAVLIDHSFPNLPLDVVTNDNYQGAYQAVSYLISKGHRRIGFLNGLPHSTIQARLEGYRRALEENNLPFNNRYILRGDLSVTGGVFAAHELVRRNPGCTAYFCANDESGIGFIQGLQANGIRVPEDISIVGFDDIEFARTNSPALTTVKADLEGLGRMAIHRLLERANCPDLPHTQTLLPTHLVERQSVKTLPVD